LLALVILLLVAGGVLAFVYNRWTMGPLPQHAGTLRVAGLSAPVNILRDERGIAHIYASTAADLFFAQGYTAAQDRWWQMEFWRHIGAGRIQELTGQNEAVMRQDVFIRTAGWYEAAEADFNRLTDRAKGYLEAFAAGVNAYIRSRPAGELAFEYNILGVTGVTIPIEDWTPIDTLVWAKVMAWDLSGNRSSELARSALLDELGEDMVNAYAPPYPFDVYTTIVQPEDLPPAGEPFAAAANSRDTAGQIGVPTRLAGGYDDAEGFVFARGAGIGSNNWVVSGSKTASGMPLLANDPHLGIQMPSIWYEIGLFCQPVSAECPFEVRGLTFATVPGVVAGHNARIAWGVTNVGPDTQDLYLLKINPENPLQYEWNGDWRDMTVREETIRYGDSPETVTFQVRLTHLGPIINDNQIDDTGRLLGFNNEDPMAFRWTAYEPGTLMESIIQLNQAQNWDEFRAALRLWDTPSQNFVYADVDGNIGYQTPGNIPIRAAGHSGLLPVDGTTDEYEWRGYVPFEYLPSIFNPERGYIATANQALVPLSYYEQLAATLGDQFGADSNYSFSQEWAYGQRGQRIVDLLEASDAHDLETFRAIQGDNKLLVAEAMAPYLAGLDTGDAALNDLRDWLLDWDYQLHMDSPQAALFGKFWSALMRNVYDDELAAINETAGGGGQEMWATLLLLQEPQNLWWDNLTTANVTESRDDIVIQSLRQGHEALVALQGSDRARWSWGQLHTATFVSNPLGLSGIDLIENMVNRGPVAASGGSDVVNATGWQIDDLTVRALPSMRTVIDLGDLSRSQVIHTTGQSGHPFSPHYGDMIDDWRMIRYHPMLWTQAQIEAAAVNRLVLEPGS
jgi:penicillin amidase